MSIFYVTDPFDTGTNGVTSNNTIFTSAAAGWTVDALIGKTLQINEGTHNGETFRIVDNDATTLTLATVISGIETDLNFDIHDGKVTEIYKYFLDGIRRYGVGVLPPDRFNRLINEAQIGWMKDKAREIGVGQKRIDDLRPVLIELKATHLSAAAGIATITNSNGIGSFVLPNGILYSAARRYWRADALRTKIENGTSWIPMTYLSNVRKTDIKRDPYGQASQIRGYYWLVGNTVKMDIGGVVVYTAEFEYYSYPSPIEYGTGLNFLEPDFEDEQVLEIIDKAVRMHLERIQSPRHPSFATEDQIKPK